MEGQMAFFYKLTKIGLEMDRNPIITWNLVTDPSS